MYAHVPYFSQRKPSSDFKTVVHDWVTTNLPDSLVNACVQLALLMTLSEEKYHKARFPAPIRLVPFLGKFLLGRLIVDIVFGVVHCGMHSIPGVYEAVHRRHHEHTAPRTQTNYHFERLDLFLEAIAPILTMVGTLHMLGIPPSMTEQSVMATTYLYYESASHSGKEMPAVTWYPLLSPLVGWLTGSDNRLVEYHTRHHQLYQARLSRRRPAALTPRFGGSATIAFRRGPTNSWVRTASTCPKRTSPRWRRPARASRTLSRRENALCRARWTTARIILYYEYDKTDKTFFITAAAAAAAAKAAPVYRSKEKA